MSDVRAKVVIQGDLKPTAAAVRATRISLGEEALVDLRDLFTCDEHGVIHHPRVALILNLIEDGCGAMREAALESIRELKKMKAGR